MIEFCKMELFSINSIILHYAFCILHYYKTAGVLELADKQASDTCVFNMRVQVPSPAPTKNARLSTKTKVRFLNDVCLRQMMWASPNDVR